MSDTFESSSHTAEPLDSESYRTDGTCSVGRLEGSPYVPQDLLRRLLDRTIVGAHHEAADAAHELARFFKLSFDRFALGVAGHPSAELLHPLLPDGQQHVDACHETEDLA